MSSTEKDLDTLTLIYQELVEKEYEKLGKFNFNFKEPRTYLSPHDVQQILHKFGSRITLSDLVDHRLLVRFSEGAYRTMHFDLLYRIIYIRNLEWQKPLPLEYKIVLRKEPVPDFDRHDIEAVLRSSIPDQRVQLYLKNALHEADYKGLSSYQRHVIEKIMSKTHKIIALVAPTASGKTLTFTIPLLAESAEKVLNNQHGTVSLLIYPRKALARDQLQKLLKLIDALNRNMPSDRLITVGIDDGDTPRKNYLRDGDSFRKLECVSCGGELVIKSKRGQPLVVCGSCGKEYPYIIPSKDEIWTKKPTILITNIWTVYRRLLSPKTINLFENLSYIVIDEAHVYTHYLGGHVSFILKMLRFAATKGGNEPTFVFSSATIPNPTSFIASLIGISEDELLCIDFDNFYKNLVSGSQQGPSRLLIHLYLLPQPYRDVETLTEAIILAVTLWCHKYGMKAITFIDSISEINTMIDYLHSTILGTREGREVLDHIFNTSPDPSNDYSWITIAPKNCADSANYNQCKTFLLTQFKQSLVIHYGGLSLEERAKIESSFAKGDKRMLLSTSTLELGIDLSDIAAVIQYKLPFTSESVIQRVGRSGRNVSCYRVALGIVVLPTMPLSTLYMFNDKLRQTLENISSLPPLRIGKASRNIALQHVFSLLLMKRALENKPTFIDESLRPVEKIIEFLQELLDDFKELHDFNKKVGLFDEQTLTEATKDLQEILEKTLKLLMSPKSSQLTSKDQLEIKKLSDDLKDDIKRAKIKCDEIQESAKTLQSKYELSHNLHDVIRASRSVALEVRPLLRSMHASVREALDKGESSVLREWLHENRDSFRKIIDNIPKLTLDHYSEVIQAAKKQPGIDFNELMSELSAYGKNLDEFRSLLQKIVEALEKLSEFSLEAFRANEIMDCLKNEYRFTQLDAFQVMNALSFGKMHFSILLQAPSPDFSLSRVDEI